MADEKDKAKGRAKPKGAGKPEKASKKPAVPDAAKEAAPRGGVEEKGPPPRLWVRYRQEVVPQIMKELGEKNVLAVPRVDKVVINMGVGKASENEKRLHEAVQSLEMITGQKPQITRAKLSIAEFHIRQGLPVGCRVTLRRARMYEFLDRLISIAIPRIRDFRGLSLRSFDRQGNFTFGVSEQVIFPEVQADRLEFTQGMDITLCTTAGNPERGRVLLAALGMPFRRPGEKDDERRKKAPSADNKERVKAKAKKEKQSATAQ